MLFQRLAAPARPMFLLSLDSLISYLSCCCPSLLSLDTNLLPYFVSRGPALFLPQHQCCWRLPHESHRVAVRADTSTLFSPAIPPRSHSILVHLASTTQASPRCRSYARFSRIRACSLSRKPWSSPCFLSLPPLPICFARLCMFPHV